MKILNGISVVHSWMTRQVDCEILADVSKDNGAVIALKTGWAPGQLWTFMKKKNSCFSWNRATKFSFIHLVPRLLTLLIN